MKNERKPKTTRIAAQPVKKNGQKTARPNEKGSGKQSRGARVSTAESHLDISSLPEQNPNPVMRFTSDGRALFGNLAAASLLGFSVDQPTREDWHALIVASFESGTNNEGEIEHNNKTFSALFVPIREAGCVNVYCSDITAYKQMQEMLKTRDAELNDIIDQTPFMMTRCTRDLRYRFVSHAYAEMIGRKPEDVAGRSILEIIGEDGLKTIMPYVERVLKGERVEYEAEVPFQSVGAPALHVIYTPDCDEAGNVIGWFASITDVTERKVAEQERIQLLKREQAEREHAQRAWTVAEEAKIRAEQELWERQQAEAALGTWAHHPLPQQSRPVWMRYGLATVAAFLAVLVRYWLDPILGDQVQFSLVVAAVAVSVWYGGLGPALLTVLLGFWGVEWFIVWPPGSIVWDLINFTRTGVFLFSSATVITLGESMHRAQRHAHQSAGVAVNSQQQVEFRLHEQQRVEESLRASEQRFREIFETAGVSVWVEDFSEVKASLEELRSQGVHDFRAYFTDNPDFVQKAIGMVRILDVNQETLDLYRASTKDELLGSLHKIFVPETESIFVEELIALAEGREIFRSETQAKTLDGRRISFLFTIHFGPQTSDYSRVIVTITDITERKQMEQSLRASEEKYRRIVETANEGIWEINAEQSTVFANPRMAEILGYTVEEIIGRSPFEFIFPEDTADGEGRMARAKRGIQGKTSEFRFRRKDGSPLWALVSSSPTLDDHGNFMGSVAMIVDISEHKRAEDEIHKLNAELQSQLDETTALLDILPTGVWIGNHDCSVITGNAAAYEMLGLSNGINASVTSPDPQSPAGLRLFMNGNELPPEDAPMQRVARSGKPLYNIEHELLFPNGMLKSMYVSIVPLFDREGKVRKVIGVYTDITERKRMEEALRVENERFMRFVDSNIVGIVIGDANGGLELANDYYLNLLGVTRQDFNAGKVDWNHFTPPEWRHADEKAIRELQEFGVCEPYEKEYLRTDGTRLPVYIANALLPGPAGGIAAFVLDITERKRAEESLKQSEERFRQFMEHLPGLAWIKDLQGRYVYANAAAQTAFRTPYERLYGKRDSEIFSAEIASQFMKNDEGALAEGGVQVVETLEHEDGVHHSLVTKFPIPGLEGVTEFIGGIAIDITEHRRAEEALRHSEERMRLAIESNRMVAWEWDPAADQVMTSANITEVYGMSEVSGAAQAFALIWPEDLPAHQEKIDRVMRQGGEYHSEFRITRPLDGKVMWMEEWASALRDDSGRVTRLVGIVTDITGRKQGEDALRQAREQAEATADRMARLQEITAALVRSVTPTELAELILEQGTRASGAAAGILVEVTNEQNLKTLSAIGYPKEVVRWEPVPLSESTPMSDCVLDGQAVWISSHEEFTAQYPSLAEFRRGMGNEAAAALPLIVGDQVIGALGFSFIEERDFLLEERGFLLAVAQQCAQAIERVRASEALRESEERYRFIVESTSDGIWQIDLKEPMPLTLSEDEQVEWYYRHAVIRQCNLELARMYGYDSVDPVIGLPMSVVMPFETNAELSRQFIRANYRLVDAESREKNKDGRDLVFLNNMIGIIKDGKLIGEWGTNRDITQRRRAENGLTLLAEISELTRDAEDPLALMAAVSDTLGRHFQVKRCLFNEIDVEDDLEVVHHDYHDGVESVQGIHKLTEYSNITTTEMMEGNTIVNFDSQTDPRTAEQYERSYMQNRERAYVAVPLMRDDQWVASLWLSTDTPRQWMDDEITMLKTVAERTWTAVEKLRINAALRDSEERLRVTFNTTAVGFATLTPDTRFVDVNQAFCSIVGYSREELLTMNFDYLTHPNYVKSTRDHMGQLLSGEVSSFVIEKLYLRKDGSEVWVQNSVSLVRDVDEHPLHLIVISQDITERKRIEEELLQLNLQLEERVEKRTRELQAASELRRMALAERQQAQDRFAKSFNASPAAMTITRFEDGMYRNVNPRFTELLEYNLEDVIGHTSLELNIYRTPQERLDLLKTIRNNKGRWDYETQLQTRTGRHLDVTISVVEIELEGEPHILSMITDVTERKQMLTALRASEQQLRTLFDVLPVGVSYVSSDGQVIESNRTLEKIIDITRDELNDDVHRTRQYIRADGTPMPLSEFASTRAMAEQRTIKNVETGIIKEGGQVIWTSVSATPISMPEPGVVVITVDVTERKHMDDELRRSHRRYQILSQRLVEIQEEERRTISRELHDRVGQSLAALNLNLNFMNQTIPANTPPPIKTRIKDAIQLTEETVSTIRDVMADLRPPALDDYGLEAALNAYADTFSRRFGIRVDLVKPAAPLPRFNSNIELTLLRIAQEALTNVAKHSHASKASIRLTLQKDAVHLSVEDNGEGIRSWQKANRPGSHGLKIMRERAETFGGTLQVQSFNQKGTKIEVKIPMQDNQPKIRAEAD